jgi:hypothetical protein
MKIAGFKLDVRKIKDAAKRQAFQSPDEFAHEVNEYTRKSLQTAGRNTPVRDLQQITESQKRQYALRVNCIPNSHRLEDPSLRIKDGKHWLYFQGRWFNANGRMPEDAYQAYQTLLHEHYRRARTAERTFIRSRTAARFLYRTSWRQAAESLGFNVSIAGTKNARSRRKPPEDPEKSFGRKNKGKHTYSISISNAFLEEPASKYKPFIGSDILRAAMGKHLSEFTKSIKRRVRQLKK